MAAKTHGERIGKLEVNVGVLAEKIEEHVRIQNGIQKEVNVRLKENTGLLKGLNSNLSAMAKDLIKDRVEVSSEASTVKDKMTGDASDVASKAMADAATLANKAAGTAAAATTAMADFRQEVSDQLTGRPTWAILWIMTFLVGFVMALLALLGSILLG